jgi:hypothetical protein
MMAAINHGIGQMGRWASMSQLSFVDRQIKLISQIIQTLNILFFFESSKSLGTWKSPLSYAYLLKLIPKQIIKALAQTQ